MNVAHRAKWTLWTVLLGMGGSAHAQTPTPAPPESPDPPETTISVRTERSTDLTGVADTATQGTVGAKQLKQRPILRVGEVLETVPGLIVTQHSGAGKANQYFLRGFNLDHGTDFATYVLGMPVNMTTHGHGQGYTDLNFLVPELISGITYRKGSYLAAQGDFSSAGSAEIEYSDRMTPNVVALEGGSFQYGRAVAAWSPKLSTGNLVAGLELYTNDGPWKRPDDARRINALLRYSQERAGQKYALTAMAYDGQWNATDQVAVRAIDSGLIDRFGTLDSTDGGKSYRYSLSGEFRKRRNTSGETRANVYAIAYSMNLWSNFTYFLDNPETNPDGQQGDQFEQADKRRVYGFAMSHSETSALSNKSERPMTNTFGIQARYDDIANVGLYNTQGRVRFNTVREDSVNVGSIAPYFENRIRWSPTFRSVAGIRADFYSFDITSNIDANSGRENDNIVSPKLSLIAGPFDKSEFYLNAGQGFHSNDGRGTTITIDPKTGDPADRVTPLVRTNQAEIGFRTTKVRGLQSTLSLWMLDIDSELVFVGDAGTTEAGRPSRRRGVEFTNFYTPKPWITLDADFSLSHARFRDDDPSGNRIPGAVENTVALGVAVDHPSGGFGALRLRYFGPRALIEDNSQRSSATSLVNGRVGYKTKGGASVALEVFNLFNTAASDIDYYYESRLRGEDGAVADRHTHPIESRSLRLNLRYGF